MIEPGSKVGGEDAAILKGITIEKRTAFAWPIHHTLSIDRLLVQIMAICLFGRAQLLTVEVRDLSFHYSRPSDRLRPEIEADATSFGRVELLTMRFLDSIRNFNLTVKMSDISGRNSFVSGIRVDLK
jgi:hypothetical protein